MSEQIYLALPMCLSAFFITHLLIFFKSRNRAQRSLLWVYLATFFLFLGKLAVNGRYFSPTVDVLYITGLLAVYPSICRTITLFCRGRLSPRLCLVLYAPAALIAIAMTVLYIVATPVERAEAIGYFYAQSSETVVLSAIAQNIGIIHNITTILYVVEVLLTAIFCMVVIDRFDKRLIRFYSNINRRSMKTMGLWLIMSIAISIITTFVDVYVYNHHFDNDWPVVIPTLILTAFLFLFGTTALKHKFSVVELNKAIALCAHNVNNAKAIAAPDKIKQQLSTLMKNQQLYLNPDLEIPELAWKLKVDCEWLSDFIERSYCATFYKWVNYYRVKRAQIMLAAPKGKEFGDVITESWKGAGFESRKEMNKVFKLFRLPPPR